MPKPLPFGLHIRDPVRITSSQVRGPKLGFVSEACKYDGGVLVWLPTEKGGQYICIADREGDAISLISKGMDAH